MADHYPTGIELQVFLVGASLLPPNPTDVQKVIDFDAVMNGVAHEWEMRTKFHPFLATSVTPSTIGPFDGQGRNEIHFSGGIVSALADGTPTVPTVSINGSIYATNFYSFKPNIAAQIGKPYTSVKFGRLQDSWLPVANGPTEDGITFLGNAQRVISITGIRGYSLVLPFDVKQCLLEQGAVKVAPRLQHGFNNGLIAQRAGNDSWTWPSGSVYKSQVDAWERSTAQTLSDYKHKGPM